MAQPVAVFGASAVMFSFYFLPYGVETSVCYVCLQKEKYILILK